VATPGVIGGAASGGSGGRRARWWMTAACAALFLAIKWNQWRNFGVHSEHAEFETRLWSTLHGGVLQKCGGCPSFFAEHVSPILLALVPAYALAPSPVTLWVVQALVLAAATIPLMALARRLLPEHRHAPLVAGLCWMASRPVNLGLTYDFHMEAAYPLAFFGALLAVERRHALRLWGWALLALSVKEDAVFPVAALGAWAAWRWRDARGLALTLGAALWLAAALWLVVPTFGAGGGYAFAVRYADFGTSVGEVTRNMLDPVRAATVVFQPAKIRVMVNTLGPFLFTPLLAPAAFVVLIAPPALTLFASSYWPMWSLLCYYALPLMPFLFDGALRGIRSARRIGGARVASVLLALMLVAHAGNSRLFRQLDPHAWRVKSRWRSAESLIAGLPRQGFVSAQSDLVAHLPVTLERRYLPEGLGRAGHLLFDTLGYTWPLSPAEDRALLERVRASGDWATVAERDGFVLLRRRR
jgi:uncharacterized membrane protein